MSSALPLATARCDQIENDAVFEWLSCRSSCCCCCTGDAVLLLRRRSLWRRLTWQPDLSEFPPPSARCRLVPLRSFPHILGGEGVSYSRTAPRRAASPRCILRGPAAGGRNQEGKGGGGVINPAPAEAESTSVVARRLVHDHSQCFHGLLRSAVTLAPYEILISRT